MVIFKLAFELGEELDGYVELQRGLSLDEFGLYIIYIYIPKFIHIDILLLVIKILDGGV